MASLGDWPTSIWPARCRFDPQTFQIGNSSPHGGAEQVLDLLVERWMVDLTLPGELFADAAAVEAFLASFRGQVNTVNLWHFARPEPRGTLRGTLVTDGTQEQGAKELTLAGGTAGGTLLAGDLLGIGGQIVMVQSDCEADEDGNITVPIVNRIRADIAGGDSVTWDKPKAPFRMLAHNGVDYASGFTSEVECTLGEAIS